MSEKKIADIQKEYKETDIELLPDFIEEYISDGRPGVSKIIGVAQKRGCRISRPNRKWNNDFTKRI